MNFNIFSFFKSRSPRKSKSEKLVEKQLSDARQYALHYRASEEESRAFAEMYEQRIARLEGIATKESS